MKCHGIAKFVGALLVAGVLSSWLGENPVEAMGLVKVVLFAAGLAALAGCCCCCCDHNERGRRK
jgi:hypothetical protein